jgi:probable addiction module antidote protein
MTKTRTRAWDAADYLDRPEDIAAYLEAALEEGDPRLIAAALGDVARSRGMTRLAEEAGLGRESLYKALSRNGNPGFATVIRVFRALGVRLRAVPAKHPRSNSRRSRPIPGAAPRAAG